MTLVSAVEVLGVLTMLEFAATLYLFTSIKRELRRATRLVQKQASQMDTALRFRMSALETAQQEHASAAQLPGPAIPLRSRLNFTTRSQIMQLHRRGESPGQIASVLSIPRNEVDLLLKVQEILVSNL
jgi:DNA-binding NarL/FixJ family response regulator